MFGQDAWLWSSNYGQISNRQNDRSDGRRNNDTRVTLVVRDGADVTIIVRDRDRSRGRSGGRG